MRPLLAKEGLWAYPFFAGIGGSFGYWLSGVERRQLQVLADRRDRLLEKRQRRAEREAAAGGEQGTTAEDGGILASTS